MAGVWRLLTHGAVDGALNMAIDRAIQLCREEGSAPPTVRLYEWTRPTVTLGRFQPVDDVDGGVAHDLGIDIVRRFTGGRGVLHADEITYSVVASTEEGIPRGVAASYAHLSRALAATYRGLGIDASLTDRDSWGGRAGACYLQSTRADLSHGTSKLSGSAQVWHGSTVMQHGSFIISRDVGREARIFRLQPDQAEDLATKTATISGILGYSPTRSDLFGSCREGFEAGLGVHLAAGELSAREADIAASLLGAVRISSRTTVVSEPESTVHL